jgi:hypothetical protein
MKVGADVDLERGDGVCHHLVKCGDEQLEVDVSVACSEMHSLK